ncbi:MAG: apolipoprotein N-acyltransferase [Desulfovibrionaceae bacterium]|nr:apolipoprotein N-acyltransferase [Desulfovibrionaceae bacterium]
MGFPNSLAQIPPLVLLFPLCLAALALTAENTGRAVAGSVCVFLLGGLLATYWLVYPLVNFGRVPFPLAFIFVILLGCFLSIYHVSFALLLRFFASRLPPVLVLLAGGLSWGALELARGWLFTGVTWHCLSSAMIAWPLLAQGASLAGMFGLSSLYALIALTSLPVVLRRHWPGRAPCRLELLGPPAVGVLLFAALLFYGAGRLLEENQGPPVILAQVQGNIDQSQKWNPDRQAETVRHYISLSEKVLTMAENSFGRQADLLVWPETAMPFFFQPGQRLNALLSELALHRRIPLLFGAPGQGEGVDPESYNRVWLLDEAGRYAGHYDKEHLVPFGEYIPRGLYVPFASEFLQGWGFSPGRDQRPLRQGSLSLGLLICYESIFPELAQARVASGANLLVNVSNDAWFADSPAPWQHLQLAAMRAVEQGRYMLRSTNTGASALITPTGRINDAGPLFKDYHSAHQAWLQEEKTFFHRNYAEITGLTACAPLLFIIATLLRPEKDKRSAQPHKG